MQKVFIRSIGVVAGAGLLLSPLVTLSQSEDTGATVEVTAETNTVTEPSGSGTNVKPRPNLPPIKPIPAVKEKVNTIKNTASTTREAIKNKVQDTRTIIKNNATSTREALRVRVTENKQALQVRKDEIKEKAKERLGEAAQNHINNIVEKLGAAADRMEEAATKIGTKITELQGRGVTLTESAALLVTAQTNIADAQVKIDAVSTALESAIDSETPKDKIAAIRSAVKAAEEALRTAKKSLESVVKSIRAEVEASGNAEIQ